jgi:hypothetical protein
VGQFGSGDIETTQVIAQERFECGDGADPNARIARGIFWPVRNKWRTSAAEYSERDVHRTRTTELYSA